MKTTRFSRSGFLISSGDSERELINIWLSMSREARKQKFAGTARAAEIAGVSQRTVQFWIDSGHLVSLRIGKKYQIYLPSLMDHLFPEVGYRWDRSP